MRPSGIGGQAVMEGVMMRNKKKYAVAVRKPDKEIVIDTQEWKSIAERIKFLGWPFVRGTVNLIESMVVGMRTLTYSANFFEVEEEPKKKEKVKKEKAQSTEESKEESVLGPFAIACTIVLSLVLSLGLFFFLPLVVTEFLQSLLGVESALLSSVLEGVLRIAIFVGYVAAISLMSDIKRVFCYHGAEHKTINCIEHGLPLTVENVRASSKEHKRCGTSFMIIVMVISILVFSIVNIFPLYTGSSKVLKVLVRFGVRLLLLPLVAGFSYEFLRFSGRHENALMNILSRPGMWMQALTTKEPDDSMIEVAIASVEAVFDWEAFLAGEEGDLYPTEPTVEEGIK